MSYKLPELPYAYDALEPVIDKGTMHLHHDKHHQAYVDNLNKALDSIENHEHCCVVELLQNIKSLPESVQTAVRNNGGGHLNHKLFWDSMVPGGSKEPVGKLADAINSTFSSFDNFKKEFESAGAARFGSGWVWLVLDDNKNLKIISTANQDSPVMDSYHPLLGNDVWEHAYYLTYQNRRAEYLKSWWSLVNWDVIEERYKKHIDDPNATCGCHNH